MVFFVTRSTSLGVRGTIVLALAALLALTTKELAVAVTLSGKFALTKRSSSPKA